MSYTTIRFDPQDRDSPAPFFRLQKADQSWVASSDLQGGECLVLLFLHAPQELACLQFLSAVQARLADYRRLDASVAAVFPISATHLPPPAFKPAILYLADPQKITRQAYSDLMAAGLVKESDVMLFVMDGYGGIYCCLVGEEPDLSAQDELLNWLNFISIQCPE